MANVLTSLSQLKLSNIWAFGRRTRDLMRAYVHLEREVVSGSHTGGLSFQLIEDCRRMMKSYRTHRNIFDQEGKWLKAEEARIAAFDHDPTNAVIRVAPVELAREPIAGPVPVILSNGTRLLIENELETFIANSDNSPMIIDPRSPDIVSLVRHHNPAETPRSCTGSSR